MSRKPESIEPEFFDFLTETFTVKSRVVAVHETGDYSRFFTIHEIGDGSRVLEECIREYPGGTVSNFLRY